MTSIQSRWSRIAPAVALTSSLVLSGCGSFFDPVGNRVNPVDSAREYQAQTDKKIYRFTLPEAEAYAFDVKESYNDHIRDEAVLRNIASAALIPIAGAAAFYGVTGAHSDVILALALGGTGTYLIGETFTSVPRQYIYASGIFAVNCVLNSYAPIRSAHDHKSVLWGLVGGPSYKPDGTPGTMDSSLLGKIHTLTKLLDAQSAKIDPLIDEAKAAIVHAHSVREKIGLPALYTLDRAGRELEIAISNVEVEVTQALLAEQVNPGALRDAVTQAFAGSIANLPTVGKPQTPTAPVTVKNSLHNDQILLQADKAPIRAAIADLNKDVQNVRDLAGKVTQPPNADALKKCAIDVDGAGVTFALNPAGPIPAQAKDNDVTVKTVVSGGRPPYSAAWVTPAKPGDLGQPQISSGGELSAMVKKGTAPGTYIIQVRDSAAQRNTVDLEVTVAGTVASGGGSGNGGGGNGGKCTSDPDVAKVQTYLQAKGVTVDDDNDPGTPEKSVNVDGCMGPITEAAIDKFLVDDQKILAPALPKTNAERIKKMLSLIK